MRLTEQTDRLWLRLARLGNHYVYASSTDGKRFVRHGLMAWGGGEPRFVGLAAIAPGDPAPPEVDVSFDFFDVQRPVGSAVVRPMDLPIVEVTEAIKRKPEDAELWFRRADLYARRGRWQEAADDLAKGLDLAPENHWHWYRSACLQLQIGNQEEYDRHCREMLRRFGETRTAHIAERVAKICLLSPDPVDTDLPARLAERAVASGPSSNIYHWFLLAKGIAEYRTGQFEQAVRRLEECRDLAPKTQTYCLAADHLFLAMANHQLGKGARARRDYEAANRIMARFPKAGGLTEIGGWNDWIIAHLARKEAEALLKAGPRQPPRDGASRPE